MSTPEEHAVMRHDHILQAIGRTPVVRLARVAPPHVELYAKVESFNPMGSVKDRMALAVIEDAEARGALLPGQTVVEATSGNTGIALAMVCARKGHPLVVVMAENFSVERRRLMRFLGAKVVLTPAALKGSGMLAKARELAATHGWFLPRQFENEANADAHRRGTAVEILEDFADAPLTHWVSGYGTGGTLRGVASVLRERSPQTTIVACEPDNSPVLSSGEPAPPDSPDGLPTSHPAFRPHLMQGWSPDFVPEIMQRTVADGLIDRVIPVPGARALECARDLARREGILVGTSGGATLAGALEVAREAPSGSRILAMLPDTGERYLSTPLFADIEAEMDADEWAISRSSPGWRFDAPPSPPPAPAAAVAAAPTKEADAFVTGAITDAARPVVMFALEWCEFCWSLRRFFKRIGVPLHAVDLDAAALRTDGRGQRIRAALNARTGVATIPQVFVAGRFVGGCMDVLGCWADGRLQAWLQRAEIPFDAAARVDTRALLPNWVHPR
jgi:cysteine synthase A